MCTLPQTLRHPSLPGEGVLKDAEVEAIDPVPDAHAEQERTSKRHALRDGEGAGESHDFEVRQVDDSSEGDVSDDPEAERVAFFGREVDVEEVGAA
jgi:hypothetical protein